MSIRDHRSLTTRSWRKLPYRVGLLASSWLTPSSFAYDASIFQTQLFGIMVWKKKKYPKTPRYNEPLHNEVHGITNDFLYSSNSKIYEKRPRYKETSSQRTNFVGPLAVRYIEVPPYKAHTRNITWPPSTPFHNLYVDCVTGVERCGGRRKPRARPRPTNFFARVASQAPLAKANQRV